MKDEIKNDDILLKNFLIGELPSNASPEATKANLRIAYDMEKDRLKRGILVSAAGFGSLVVSCSILLAITNDPVVKLVLVAPTVIFGGKNLKEINENVYSLKRINREINKLK